jgi:PAS domain S-box-containing protein
MEVSLSLFKKLVDEASDGYMIIDGEGKIIYTNRSYLTVSDKVEEGMVGHNMQEYIDDGSLEESVALAVLKERHVLERPSMIRRDIPLSISSTPIFDVEGNIKQVVTVTRDISQLTSMKKTLDYLLQFLKTQRHSDKNILGDSDGFVAASPQMKQIFKLADSIKDVMSTIILYGETGVGKDVIARYIHNSCIRKYNPYICINCSAIPEQLLETELFGYAGGAFTDATKGGKKGLFEAAQEGTLFLDEVGDMSLALQAKLLRVLETRVISRVGDPHTIPVDVRVIAATNRNLEAMVQEKEFREDLYYRLNVLPIQVPPLRERSDDIIPLCLFYLNKFCMQYNRRVSILPDALEILEQYDWPGNIRELKNIIERMVVTANKEAISKEDVIFYSRMIQNFDSDPKDIIVKNIVPLEQAIHSVEKQLLIKAKMKYKGCRKIADALEVNYSTIARKLQFYNL